MGALHLPPESRCKAARARLQKHAHSTGRSPHLPHAQSVTLDPPAQEAPQRPAREAKANFSEHKQRIGQELGIPPGAKRSDVWGILKLRTEEEVPKWGQVMFLLERLEGNQDLTAGSAIHLLQHWGALKEVMERESVSKLQGKALCQLVANFRKKVLGPISRDKNRDGSSSRYIQALDTPFGAKIGGKNEGSGACRAHGCQNFTPSFERRCRDTRVAHESTAAALTLC